MVKGFEHLSDAQLEHYGTQGFEVTSEDAQRMEAHLEKCAVCRSRVLEHQRARFVLTTNSSMNTPLKPDHSLLPAESEADNSGPHGADHTISTADPYIPTSAGCTLADGPSENDLRSLAAGHIAGDSAETMTRHVAECPRCAFILRAFTEDFSDDQTPGESATLSELESSSPEWQKKLLRKILPPR